jgi:dipeptidyl aminopeptidase/acylaminoacyl peptidase
MSLQYEVTARTPPTFLVTTEHDTAVPADNSILFFQALKKAGVPAELHVFEKGGHGYGLLPGNGTTSEWPARCEEWLRMHQFIP